MESKENKNKSHNNNNNNENDNYFEEFLSKTFTKRKSSYFLIIIFINIFSLFIKFSIGLYGYSGELHSPKFGDYEAQRHWMEMTNNLNITNWYTNSTMNPSYYWPMDYPPMSGYHAFLFGKINNFLLPESTKLKSSWGYESLKHKILMRLSAIISDLIFFHIPIYFLLKFFFLKKNFGPKKIIKFSLTYFLILIFPCHNIIDHGHFQFNCVMHGLFYFSVFLLLKKNFIFAIIIYSMCINFKQMGMYFALVYLFYVLNDIVNNKEKNVFSFNFLFNFFAKVLFYGFITIVTNILIWSPWVFNGKAGEVFTRIFPIQRGIFEDKVATFWCNLNIFFKLQNFDNKLLFIISLSLTILGCLFSLLLVFFYNKKSQKNLEKLTIISLFICAMSFYLFSFHVHEKTILVPLLPFLIISSTKFIRSIAVSFYLVSLFSLFPLLKRENQEIPYITLMIFVYFFGKIFYFFMKKKNENVQKNCKWVMNIIFLLEAIEYFDIIFIIGYHYCEKNFAPPAKYPWIYPLINAAFSFMHFIGFYLLANLKMILIYRKEIK